MRRRRDSALAGLADARYLGNGAKQSPTNGGWDLPDKGSCIVDATKATRPIMADSGGVRRGVDRGNYHRLRPDGVEPRVKPLVEQVVVIGDQRKYPAALIVPNSSG